MVALTKTTIFLILAVLFAALALLVPAHIRSVDSAVIRLAATQDSSPADKISEALNAAQIGPAEWIISATRPNEPERERFSNNIQNLLANNPQFATSGGADRSFEDFLELVQNQPAKRKAVVPLLLPRSERASLSGMLANSSNANVAALLDARNLRGLLRLHPANHAAGAPFDSGVLTLATLVEGGHFRPALAQQIGAIATQATLGTPTAVRSMENLVIATLSLGRQLDYLSLTTLAKITQQPADWNQMGTLFRAQPNRVAQLYTALYFSENTESLFNYLANHPETGNEDLDFALQHGPAAVSTMLERQQPLYRPPPIPGIVLDAITPYRSSALSSITLAQPQTGLLLKFSLLFVAGLAFAFAMGAAWRGSFRSTSPVSKFNPAIIARDTLLSLVVVISIWTFFEPNILKSHDTETDSGPRIEFAVVDSLQSLKSPIKSMQELNQATLLVLALFFIIQLVIYCFCLIKLREISKQKLGAELKIRLLENEENLFDFGLYVGLGGTVLSLILVAVGIVEASLMAAYASTLFGILFTALLKVINLRPYRRSLIIEASSSRKATDPGTLMKNIEL